MRANGLLSAEDIDRVAEEAIDSETPEILATSLVEAVEDGRIEDAADAGYALIVAAGITGEAGDPEAAIALAERGIEAYERSGIPSVSYPRGVLADLLFLAGRDDDAMTQLSSLRERLTEDSTAAALVGDVLVANGRAKVAEEWLTEALDIALRSHRELESKPSDPRYDELAMVVYELLQARHAARHELGLPHDDRDDLAEELLEALDEPLDGDDEGPAVMFLPRPEYDEVLRRWPELAAHCGATWDEHRALTERGLKLLAEYGAVQLALVPGSADGLAAFITEGIEQVDGDAVRAYSDSLQGLGAAMITWPPGRNEPCWCGSTSKYKKCCLPRS
ncbi:SEC-C domain-containing protein [Kribbella sp. HUAS MG21]|uniref:SEC-C domain-containing protein n=1 Tax=Kribbella sp. HUAS MG21 TaxID=3160966 RepID=A0AAU7TLR5_9ACTN